MSTTKVAITINDVLLKKMDQLVAKSQFPYRSQAIQEAVREKLERLEHNRLARESAKLDPVFEQSLAEEGLAEKWDANLEYAER